MAMRTLTAMRLPAGPAGGLRGMLYSSISSGFPFFPPETNQVEKTAPAPAEPSVYLLVSGLSKRTTTEELKSAFEKSGNVVHAKIVTDRASGYSKGYGFVQYATLDEAAEGIKAMDGKFMDGWIVFAEYARPRPQPGQQPENNGYAYGRH